MFYFHCTNARNCQDNGFYTLIFRPFSLTFSLFFSPFPMHSSLYAYLFSSRPVKHVERYLTGYPSKREVCGLLASGLIRELQLRPEGPPFPPIRWRKLRSTDNKGCVKACESRLSWPLGLTFLLDDYPMILCLYVLLSLIMVLLCHAFFLFSHCFSYLVFTLFYLFFYVSRHITQGTLTLTLFLELAC